MNDVHAFPIEKENCVLIYRPLKILMFPKTIPIFLLYQSVILLMAFPDMDFFSAISGSGPRVHWIGNFI